MGFYAAVKAIEDEIITILQDASADSLESIRPQHIVKGLRTLTDYATLGDFPWIEVSWGEEEFDGGGGVAKREHIFAIEIAVMDKREDPLKGLEAVKILIGDVYDVLISQGDLNCQADFLGEGRIELMPVRIVSESGYIYVAVGTFNYHKRI